MLSLLSLLSQLILWTQSNTRDNVLLDFQNCRYYRFIVFNATFNNISVISWRSVLFVEETGVPGENHQSVASQRQLYHILLSDYEFS
jgi:hypothetical protein